MATYVKFNPTVEALAEKKHDWGADSFYLQFSNNAPSAANGVETDLPADLSTGGGYTAGGINIGAASASSQSSGTYKLVIPDYTFTASGAVGPFRYVVLGNITATNKEVVGYYDYGVAGVTLANGETFLVDFDGTNGVLTLA